MDGLPPEVIALILRHLAERTDEGDGRLCPSPLSPLPYDWTVVTQVSRTLRAVALSFPELWTHIDSYPKKRAEIILRRSRKLPFSYSHSLCHTLAETSVLLKSVFSQHFRICELHIEQQCTSLDDLLKFLALPLPLLRSLVLFVDDRSRSRADCVLLTHTPILRCVKLVGVSLIPSPSLTGVTKLNLSFERVDIPVEDLRVLLEGMPKLRTLSIKYPFWDEPSDGGVEHTIFHLPSLRTFYLVANFGFELFLFYARFAAPQLRHLSIHYTPSDDTYDSDPSSVEEAALFEGSEEPFTALPCLLSMLNLRPATPVNHDMIIYVNGTDVVEFILVVRPSHASDQEVTPPLVFQYQHSTVATMDFERICALLPLHSLMSLTVRGYNVDPETPETQAEPERCANWIDVLGRSATLSRIYFTDLDALVSLANRWTAYPLIYPSLHHIIVRNWEDVDFDLPSIYSMSFAMLLGERALRGIYVDAVIVSPSGACKLIYPHKSGYLMTVIPTRPIPYISEGNVPEEFEELWSG